MLSTSCWLLEANPCIISSEQRPHCVFQLVSVKISSTNTFIFFYTANLALTYQNTHFGSVLWVSESVVGLKQPPRAWKHIGGASLFGGLVVIVVDLGAQKDKFAANSGPKPVEEIKLLWNLMPVQTVLLLTFFLDDPVHDQPLENYPFTFQNPLRIKWLVKWIVSKKMPMSF